MYVLILCNSERVNLADQMSLILTVSWILSLCHNYVSSGKSDRSLIPSYTQMRIVRVVFKCVLLILKHPASIAQWLEHWSCKPGVVSTILSGGFRKYY